MPSPIGRLEITATGDAITSVSIERAGVLPRDGQDERPDDLLLLAADELCEYFAGLQTAFTVPIEPRGTPFQRAVWNGLRQVPSGSVTSYGELAIGAGKPRAGRAAGQAVKANPVAILIPCHRVLAAGARITGYSGGSGISTKEWLLAHEGIDYRL